MSLENPNFGDQMIEVKIRDHCDISRCTQIQPTVPIHLFISELTLSIISNLESHFKPIFKGLCNKDKIRNCFDKRSFTNIWPTVQIHVFLTKQVIQTSSIRNLKQNLRVTVFIIEIKGPDLKFYAT